MDSELTLVSPRRPITLRFDTNNILNATLLSSDPSPRPMYTIFTPLQARGGSTTEIRAADTTRLLGRIVQREILPDTVIFPDSNFNGGREMKLSKWLKKQKNGLTHTHTIDTELGPCILKQDPVYRLALFAKANLDAPIAHWGPESISPGPLSLVIHPITEGFHPQIIAAFILEEQKMRMIEKRDYMAQGMGVMLSKGGAFTSVVML